MSDGKRIPRSEAMPAAQKIVDLLFTLCERIEIAGSLRRGKTDVGDIEIVCIPKLVTWVNLLGEEVNRREPDDLTARMIVNDYHPTKNGDHFKQFDIGLCNLDLFITTPECWGVIFTIRTGSADFSHRLVTTRQQGGLLPSNMRVKDGRLWLGDVQLDTPEEGDFFRYCGLKWIDPKDRK